MEQRWLNTWHELFQKKIQAWIERIPQHIEEIIRVKVDNTYKKGRIRKDTRDWKADGTRRLAGKLTKRVNFGTERGITKVDDEDNNNMEVKEIHDRMELSDHKLELEYKLELKNKLNFRDKLELEDELELDDELELEDESELGDKLEVKNRLESELGDKLEVEDRLEAKDKQGLGNKPELDDEVEIGHEVGIGEDGMPSSAANAWQSKPWKRRQYKAKAPAKQFEEEVQEQLAAKRQEAQTSPQKALVEARLDKIAKNHYCLHRSGQAGYLSLRSTSTEEEFIISFPSQKTILGCVGDKVVKKAKAIRKKLKAPSTTQSKGKGVATARKAEVAMEIPVQVLLQAPVEAPIEATKTRAGRVVKKKVFFESGRN